jgi:hypothetical protein
LDTLIQSLRTLIKQSTEAFGSDNPATLNLQEQLAAALERQEQARKKVFWIQPQGFTPGAGEKKG